LYAWKIFLEYLSGKRKQKRRKRKRSMHMDFKLSFALESL
jgi:hypothetical protein